MPCACLPACIVCLPARIYARIHACIHARTRANARSQARVHACIHACTHAHTHARQADFILWMQAYWILWILWLENRRAHRVLAGVCTCVASCVYKRVHEYERVRSSGSVLVACSECMHACGCARTRLSVRVWARLCACVRVHGCRAVPCHAVPCRAVP